MSASFAIGWPDGFQAAVEAKAASMVLQSYPQAAVIKNKERIHSALESLFSRMEGPA